jgi:hypothetical protein
VENYFNYFTEIEEQFLRRRGGGLLLTTLDWALIETWKDAGIPLQAVLRGIDAAFDRYDQRPSKSKKINSLAYCSQEVLTAAEDMKEAAVGVSSGQQSSTANKHGFESETIAAYLVRNARFLEAPNQPRTANIRVEPVVRDSAATLRRIAEEITANKPLPKLEDLERRLTVIEEKIFAVLLAATPDEELVAVRAQADRELAPYRSKMMAAQVDQLQKQYTHKFLLEKYGLPRLSLFYM